MPLPIRIVASPKNMPRKAHEDDVGWDCYAATTNPMRIPPNSHVMIPLGFSIAVPRGYTADIRPRSGLMSRGIMGMYGTVDPGYTGEVMGCLFNTSQSMVVIKPHDRIAQLVILATADIKFDAVERLEETERGSDGFGSTGR